MPAKARKTRRRTSRSNGKGAPLAPAREAEVAEESDDGPSFGRRFFLTELAPLVRDRCPEASERQPRVFVHVVGGDVLEVCRVIGLAQRWVSLSVVDDEGAMYTEIVPYGAIHRITISSAPRDSAIGFRDEAPAVVAKKLARGPRRRRARTAVSRA